MCSGYGRLTLWLKRQPKVDAAARKCSRVTCDGRQPTPHRRLPLRPPKPLSERSQTADRDANSCIRRTPSVVATDSGPAVTEGHGKRGGHRPRGRSGRREAPAVARRGRLTVVSSRPPSIRACGSPAHDSPTFFTAGIQLPWRRRLPDHSLVASCDMRLGWGSWGAGRCRWMSAEVELPRSSLQRLWRFEDRASQGHELAEGGLVDRVWDGRGFHVVGVASVEELEYADEVSVCSEQECSLGGQVAP